MAAQLLKGNGFRKVYNLSGGIKAWRGEAAVGAEDLGLALFSGSESPQDALKVAYSLEEGLRDFYLSMAPVVKKDSAREMFTKLADIEVQHQDQIFETYAKITTAKISREEFENDIHTTALEGGLTTAEYIDLFQSDLESVTEIISIAMSIEAQAMDLYTRASANSNNKENKKILLKIAAEERSHLSALGKLMDLA